MPPRTRVNVAWFKCTDLRAHDHAALKAAHAGGLPVLHLYVFDPFWYAKTTRICGFPRTGAVRTRFQLEAVADLSSRLASEGQVLNTRAHVSTAACFEDLCKDFEVNAVFAFREVCSEELRVERQVREVLRRNGQGPLQLFWGFELYHHDDLSFKPATARFPFKSYTAFRKLVEENSRVRPSRQQSPDFRKGPDASVRWDRADAGLPSVPAVMGPAYDPALDPGEAKDPRAELRWQGGETAALERVKEYLWDQDSLGLDYVGATMTTDPAKSCMRDKAMSKISPWLAHGCLSPRLLYEEVQRYERSRRKTKSTYWIKHELLWRDFVRFASMQAGTSIFKIGGPTNSHPSWQWSTNRSLLGAWQEGNTGFPFVDCFMRELKATGYCSHMGRECAGWFLIGDLGIDWRMGAEWLESALVDYEPTANWYNWTYRCLPAIGRGGSTPPGERLQGLEILRWGTQHDPDAAYIKRWIPELAPLPATIAREPWRLGLVERQGGSEPAGLRERPTGRFSVNKEAVQALLSMGFDQSDAAIALHRAWGDVDAAVALLLSEGEGAADQITAEDEELESAIKLSLQEAGVSGDAGAHAAPPAVRDAPPGRGSQHGGFRYGEDYPRPVIQPVSLLGTEEAEAEARAEQAKRDQQIAAARQRCTPDGQREVAEQRRPAEVPTARSWRRDRQGQTPDEAGGTHAGRQPAGHAQDGQAAGWAKGAGERGKGGRAAAWQEAEVEMGRGGADGAQGNLGEPAAHGERKRRWNDGRGRVRGETLRGA